MNNVIIKNGSEFFILRSIEPLQSCSAQKKSARKAELAGQFAATLKGLGQFQKNNKLAKNVNFKI